MSQFAMGMFCNAKLSIEANAFIPIKGHDSYAQKRVNVICISSNSFTPLREKQCNHEQTHVQAH